jgi:hypothetical protein
MDRLDTHVFPGMQTDLNAWVWPRWGDTSGMVGRHQWDGGATPVGWWGDTSGMVGRYQRDSVAGRCYGK